MQLFGHGFEESHIRSRLDTFGTSGCLTQNQSDSFKLKVESVLQFANDEIPILDQENQGMYFDISH